MRELGYNGIVYSPEHEDGKPIKDFDLGDQVDWEHYGLNSADAIVFWIPRQMREDFEMLALTTNIEFGLYFKTDKLFVGSPKEAQKNNYLQYISQNKYKWHDDLKSLLTDVVNFIGEGVYRKGIETKIPQHIFSSKQFQDWYQAQLAVGNYLTDWKFEYEFYMPIQKKLFVIMFKPSVYIAKENRIKDIEFVIARTNMSYILAYSLKPNIMDSEILICKEFRSPVCNEEEYIYELPGGSSVTPEDALTTACHELKEETGLIVDPKRMNVENTKQSAGTLCSHKISLFSIELTEEEINTIKNDKTIHGVVEDTERVYVEITPVKEVINKLDWTNTGLILEILLKKRGNQ